MRSAANENARNPASYKAEQNRFYHDTALSRSVFLPQLKRMKELCIERNNLYEEQNDLKGQKWKIENSLER